MTFGLPSSVSTLTSIRLAWWISIPCSTMNVGVQSLDDLEGPDWDLERLDSRRRDLREEALQADVLRSDTEGARERLDVLQLGAERGLALGHDHLSHLAALADQFEGQHADLQFLIDHRGTIRMRDEAFLGRDVRRPDRRMARERDLSAGREDPVPVVRGRVARGKNERRLGDVHLSRDPQHLRGGKACGPREYRERVPAERRVGEDIDSPVVEEPFRHGAGLAARMVVLALNSRPTGFCGSLPSRGEGDVSPYRRMEAVTIWRSKTTACRTGCRSCRHP